MGSEVKRLVLLGSTGSIGRQTLEVVSTFPQHLRVEGLAAGQNEALLAQQVRRFQPRFVHLGRASGRELFEAVPLSPEEMACHPDVDVVVVATSGKAGLTPTLAALRAGKRVALANKEVLVMAGELVVAAAKAGKGELVPIDSEHSALWQCLRGEDKGIARLIITASGGAFRDLPQDRLAGVTAAEALHHPTWRMGRKVTIDSATLMNKGLETIEARWLFDTPLEKIEVVLHHESLVHSLVEFGDGSVKAQLGPHDMRLPIQYALSAPERWPNRFPRLTLAQALTLHFEPLDLGRYPCLMLAREAGQRGGTYPTVLCAADEIAVDAFLEGRLGFMDIPRVIEEALANHRGPGHPSLDEILAADAWAREHAARRVQDSAWGRVLS